MQTEQGRPVTMNNETRPVPVELTDRWVDDDSIDLFELAATLWEGKWAIVGVCLAALAAAGGWLLLQSPVYEARAVVEIGQVADGEPLFDRGRLLRQLEEVHVVRHGDQPAPDVGLTAVGTVRHGSDRALELTAQGDDPLAVAHWLEAFVSELLDAHAQAHDERLQLVHDSLVELAERKAEIDTTLKALQADVASSTDPIVRATLALQQSGLLAERGQLLQRRLAIEETLQEHTSYPSRMWGAVTAGETPVAPRGQLVLAIALLLGGLLGSMAVLIRKQWQQRVAAQ